MVSFINLRLAFSCWSSLAMCMALLVEAPLLFAQPDPKIVLSDWNEWISRVQIIESVKITELRQGDEESKANVFLLGLGAGNNLHRSFRFHSDSGWIWNHMVGNKDYLFALRDHREKIEIASLTLRSEPNYETAYKKLLEDNVLNTMCLLTGASDSIHPMVSAGTVMFSEYQDENSAKFIVKVDDSFEDAEFLPVTLVFSRQADSKWYPHEVKWKVNYTDGSNLETTYAYLDWIDHRGLRVPTRIKASRNHNKSTDIKLFFDLTDEELNKVKRFWLSDFSLPEPKIESSIPTWIWGIVAGIAFLVIALIAKRNGG